MSDYSQTERIRNPFTSREREFLRSLSGYAKDNDLLTGYQRKVLYEGGRYNYVFVGRLAKVSEALADLSETLTSDDEQYIGQVSNLNIILTNRYGIMSIENGKRQGKK